MTAAVPSSDASSTTMISVDSVIGALRTRSIT
jgi:hypothetical protein